MTAVLLFVLTAFFEIVGCFAVYVVLERDHSPWLLAPAMAALAVFAWLLTWHPSVAGRTYAAYAGVYLLAALTWMWVVEGQTPNKWDLIGSGLGLLGAVTIVLGRE